MTQTPKPPISHIDGVSVETLTAWDYENGLSAAQLQNLPDIDEEAVINLQLVLDSNDCWISGVTAKIILSYLLASGEVVLRKDVEELVKFAQSFHVTVTDSYYKDVYLGLHEPHSLTLRLGNDSTKSFIFADLEKRRVEALAAFTKPPLVDLMDNGE